MSARKGPRVLTRRQLLKVAGAAAAAIAAPSLSAPAHAARAGRTIAVLVPASQRYPGLGAAFADGVRRGLSEARRPARLLQATLSSGQANAPAALGELLAGSGRPIAIGLLGAERAPELHAALAAQGGVFVAADLGANIPRHGEASPRVLSVSLGAWQAAYALGAWAASSGLRRAAAALSLYESGYDLPFAFRAGYEAAGGEIVGTEITNVPGSAPGHLDAALGRLAALGPEVVFGAYSGDEAVAFTRAYAASSLGRRVPLVGPGFLADESLIERLGGEATGVRTALAWGNAPLRPRLGRPALGPIALLGYEAAQLALRAEAALDGRDSSALDGALPALTVSSPRGELRLDPASRAAHGPIILREVRATPSGVRSVAVATLPAPAPDDAALAALRDAPRTGWLHGYLAI